MNVTPLVDVVLVLLIIFMIVIPAMEESLNLEVPAITNPDEEAGEEGPEPVMLALTATGGVYLEERRVPEGALIEHLSAIHAQGPRRRLVLRGDRGVRYADVRDLYGAAQSVGFPGVSLRVSYLADRPADSPASDAERED